MSEQWNDEQIKLLLECLSIVDDGDPLDITNALTLFLNNTSWNYLESLDRLAPSIDWNCCNEWNIIRPEKGKNKYENDENDEDIE